MLRKVLMFVGILSIVMVGVLPSFAQTSTFTLTEEFINQSYRVTNPSRTTVTNVSVDLKPNQVVISATFTPRRSTTSSNTITTLSPSLENGVVNWEVMSLTVDGVAANQEWVNTLNNAIVGAWQLYFRQRTEQDLLSINISETQIDYTYTSNSVVNPNIVPNTNGTTTLTILESNVNDAINVEAPLTNLSVDFQPNQIVINATATGRNNGTISASATVVPTLDNANGDVEWTVTSFTVTGTNTQRTINRIEDSVYNTWQRYWTLQVNRWDVSSISITDTQLIVIGTVP
jgi:carbon monoxide dehydrogenase subunit G